MPMTTRKAASVFQELIKPVHAMTTPHVRHTPGRKYLGPIFLARMALGHWKMMYGTKKRSTQRDLSPSAWCYQEECRIPLT